MTPSLPSSVSLCYEAGVLWRLRRATTMETGLFEIQAEHLREYRHGRQLLSNSQDVIHATLWPANVVSHDPHTQHCVDETAPAGGPKSVKPQCRVCRCFLRLANLPNFALDRLSRYEATLWRQASQILYTLEALDRHKTARANRPFLVCEQKTDRVRMIPKVISLISKNLDGAGRRVHALHSLVCNSFRYPFCRISRPRSRSQDRFFCVSRLS